MIASANCRWWSAANWSGWFSIGDIVQSLYEQVEAENEHLMNYLHGRS
jgi:hypothetical protein